MCAFTSYSKVNKSTYFFPGKLVYLVDLSPLYTSSYLMFLYTLTRSPFTLALLLHPTLLPLHLSQVVWYDRSDQNQPFRPVHSRSATTCHLARFHQPAGSAAAVLHTGGSAAQMGPRNGGGLCVILSNDSVLTQHQTANTTSW